MPTNLPTKNSTRTGLIFFKETILIKILLPLAILVIALESFLRINYKEELVYRQYPSIYTPDSVFGWKYTPNSQGTTIQPYVNHNIMVNSDGFIGDEISKSKPDSTYRIALVGSSLVAGTISDSPKTLAVQLNHIFALNNLQNIEVINLGIDGIENKEILDLAVLSAKSFDADLTLCFFPQGYTLNYFESRRSNYRGYKIEHAPTAKSINTCKKTIDRICSFTMLQFLYEHSYIVRAALRKFANKNLSEFVVHNQDYNFLLHTYIVKEMTDDDSIINYRYSYEKSIEKIKDAIDLIKGEKGSFYFVGFDETMRNSFEKLEFPMLFLDGNEVFSDHSIRIHGDGHFNTKGNYLLAKGIYNQLLENNVIKNPI